MWEQERTLALGIALARHRRLRVSGAGAAVAIQGAFLLLHDARYAWRTRPATTLGVTELLGAESNPWINRP